MMGLGMKQFEKMGWIRQGFLGVIICVVMSPSNAMTVRERYLQQNPQAAAHQDAGKTQPNQTAKHSKKHLAIEKATPARQKTTHRRHVNVAQPIAKHSRVQHAKRGHQRVILPKHSKSKFDKQQARDAQAALKHRSVKRSVKRSMRVKQAPTAKHHVRKASAKHVTHHVAKPVLKHHRKHHRAR